MPCDPQTLSTAAVCYPCVPDGYKPILNNYLLAQAVGLSGVSPATLIANSTPYDIFSGGIGLAAKTYLLAIAAGASTNPTTLAQAAYCYYCKIPTGFQQDVETYLYSQIADGSGMTLAGNIAAAKSFQVIYGVSWRVELYLLAYAANITNLQTIMNGALCFFSCLSSSTLIEINTYLLCQASMAGGLGNLVPTGSTYSGATPTFTLNVNPNTSYIITWGANDVSMTMGGVTYTSTGSGTQTTVYTGANTQMVFTGTFAGTTVTVKVAVAPPAKVPIPSGFTAVLNAAGTSIVVGWDTPTLTFVNYTEVWTSNDNVTYTLAATVNFPTASTTVPAPSAGSTKYVKIRWCSNALAACGQFTSPLNAPNTVVSNWATRVVTNGGAAVSQATISAVDTFYAAISSFASLFKTLNVVAPDSVFAAITPLIKNNGSDPWAPNGGTGSVGAGVVTVNGWQATGDTGSHYLDPGITPSGIASFSASNGGMTIYAFTLISEGSNVGQCGCTDAASRRFQLDLNDSSGPSSVAIMCNDFGTSQSGGGAGSSKGAGFYSENRVDASNHFCYFAKSSSAFAVAFARTGVTNVNTPPQVAFLFAGYNTNGVKNASGSRYSFFAIHDALTSAQAQTLYNAVQALRTALGGGFV